MLWFYSLIDSELFALKNGPVIVWQNTDKVFNLPHRIVWRGMGGAWDPKQLRIQVDASCTSLKLLIASLKKISSGSKICLNCKKKKKHTKKHVFGKSLLFPSVLELRDNSLILCFHLWNIEVNTPRENPNLRMILYITNFLCPASRRCNHVTLRRLHLNFCSIVFRHDDFRLYVLGLRASSGNL